ncbi:hypothetical protein PS1_036566 [Malus domestica]|uniref:uncharacterized protein n=1 Tax=Malus domestica TaxID=3750 RepID=UPI0010AA4B25|nr:uncharacterized protein LOC103414047 [Malus domestica]
MQRAVVQVKSISALKVCRNHAGKITQLAEKVITPFPPTTPSQQLRSPCVDLYFCSPVEGSYFDCRSISEYQQTLVQKLLPQAWSHDPLTTLKLILHLPGEAFYAAAVWLHHNHPKTLACNLLPIADDGGIASVLEILSRLDVGHSVDDYPWTWTRMLYNISRQQNFCANPFVFRSSRAETTKEKASALLKRRKTIAMANKVAERYDRDPHYRFLHDRVSDLIAECLKYDIQELNKLKHKQQQQQQGEEGLEMLELKITSAASYCPSRPNSSKAPRPTGLLYESIARKFPLGMRLRKEVLVPLRQAMASRKSVQDDANPWGYDYHPFPRTECPIFKYMLELNEAIAAKSKSVPELIETGALLPHQILRYARKFEQAAELLWERMVEDLHQKQGKLNNCLVVCNVDTSSWFCSEAGPLGLLVSQLNSQNPWKGKVVSYTRNPQMHLIPPGKDLRSKCKFMGSWEEKDWGDKDWEKEVDAVKKVFDLILEVAVKENVKPEQMINKVFVFKEKYGHKDLTWSGIRNSIFCDYKEIQRRFEAKGYTVPHLMIWSTNDGISPLEPPECSVEQGVTLLRGFSDNLVKSFLDNDGEIGPEEIMEAAISGENYQTLAVVD